jgi:hypothetical protein
MRGCEGGDRVRWFETGRRLASLRKRRRDLAGGRWNGGRLAVPCNASLGGWAHLHCARSSGTRLVGSVIWLASSRMATG